MQTTNTINLPKYYNLIATALIVLLFLDIIKNSYGLLWWLKIHAFGPLYSEWIQYTVIDLVNIALLFSNRFRVLGLILMAGNMIFAISYLFATHTASVSSSIQSGNILGVITLIAWWIALLLSIIGLFFWWKLHIDRAQK